MLLIKYELFISSYEKAKCEVKSSGRITCGFDVCGRSIRGEEKLREREESGITSTFWLE